MYCRSEGWLTVNKSGRRWTDKDIRSRCPLPPRAESPMSFQHPAQTRIEPRQFFTSNPFNALALPSFPGRPGTPILLDRRSEGSLTVDNYARRWTNKGPRSRRRRRRELITINILLDDVLLEILDYCLREKQGMKEWIALAHVCRRWRSVLFQSPRRLNLRLLCTPETPARTLDIWPPLPLIIQDSYGVINHRNDTSGVDNIVAALEHNNRVCQIEFRYLSSSQLEYVMDSVAMHEPFPELTDLLLRIFVVEGSRPILPDSFLGGTAPRLQSLYLEDVPFPGLPKLLLSATHLVKLDLSYIPCSGYIPPEAMAIGLSALTSLESLHLHFLYPRPRPTLKSRRPPPPPLTRSILPSLIKIRFKGNSEYLEVILARIDAPRLSELDITFFNQIIFHTPQLLQFISRRPTLRAPQKGHIVFSSKAIIVKFPSQTSVYGVLRVQIPCTVSEWQLSSIEQVCTSSLPLLSKLEDLYIFGDMVYPPLWQDDIENMLWLDLLRLFVFVKSLYLSREFEAHVALALQELVGGRTTEVLPTLENIFLEGLQPSGLLQEGIGQFVAARQLTSHPVAVSRWDGHL